MKYNINFRWVLVVIILFGLVGRAASGSTIYARLAYVSLILLAGGYLWTLFSLRGIQLQREARHLRASMGDVFEEHFEVSNTAWPGCLWLEVMNQSTLPNASGSRLMTAIGPRQRRFYTARTLLVQRGAFTLGPTKLTSGDPLGLFTTSKVMTGHKTLVVLPMTVKISEFPVLPGLLPGGKSIRQKSLDVTPHAAGVREYLPGDPMKRIHWPSTAHRGRFMVKEFEQDPQAEIWLFLDAQTRVQVFQPALKVPVFEDGWWLQRRSKVTIPCDTFEYAVSAAASLARHFLHKRYSVGLASAAGKFTIVSAERGERQIGKIMETLAFLQPEGKMSLYGMVTMQAKLLPMGSSVILITPSPELELILVVEDLQRRHLRPIVVFIEAVTFGGVKRKKAVDEGLIKRNVPTCQIGFGDDLALQLARVTTYFQQTNPLYSFFSSDRS